MGIIKLAGLQFVGQPRGQVPQQLSASQVLRLTASVEMPAKIAFNSSERSLRFHLQTCLHNNVSERCETFRNVQKCVGSAGLLFRTSSGDLEKFAFSL